MKIKAEQHVEVKMEQDDESNQWPSQPAHSDSDNRISDRKLEDNTNDSHEDRKRKIQIHDLSDDKIKDEERKRKRRERNKRHRENKKNKLAIPVNEEKREAEKHKNREKTQRYREKKKNSGIAEATVSITSDSFSRKNAEKCKRYRDKKRMSQFQTKNMYNSQNNLYDAQIARPEKIPNADRQKEVCQRRTQELAEIKLRDLQTERQKSGSNEDQENIMLPSATQNVENVRPQENQNLSQWLHICEEKRECISPDVILRRFTGIPGDGNCLFHSLISVRRLSISTAYLRNQLRDSPDLPLCHDPRGVYDILSSTNAYGDSDCVFLFSRMYNQNICVHYDFRAQRRLDDGTYKFYDDTIFCIYTANDSNNWIHLHLFGQHYTPYFEGQDLLEENGDIRRKEVNVDANNVCDNDTDSTEDNQGNYESDMVVDKERIFIKQERLSTFRNVQSPATDPSIEEYSSHFVKTEFETSKSGSSSPNNPEVTSSFRENTEFVSVKCEYDDASNSNDIEEEELSVQPIPHCIVKVEEADEGTDKTNDRNSPTRDNLTEKDKHFANIKSLLECTNATLIRSQEDVGYTCYFCDKYFQDPSDLKDHATNTHTVIEEKDFTKIYIAGYVGKMDITGLSCKLCFASIETLENSISHLHDVHRKNIFLDLKNQILPFKFNSNVHRCCICSKEFNKFRSLQSHVQTHYRNYECEECDMAFINRMKLVQHLQAHVVGEFKCQFCSKQFNTEFKKKKHEKNVHDQSLKVKCGICNERFKYPRQKELHMTKIHSLEPTNKCNLCEKVFVTQDTLSVHVKRDHLKTRNARCPECEMCFFSPSQLRIHMVKHTGIPQFECDICHKSYRRKNYYYEHMRIHTNDRRHKCKLCDMAFVHKSSLRHHLTAKHGEKYVPGFH